MRWLKRTLIKYLTDKLLRPVTVQDLLRIEAAGIYIGKTKLTKEEVTSLVGEAKNFEKSLLWNLMRNNVYWIANFKMIKGERDQRDIDFGRGTVHGIDVCAEFIEKLTLLR